MQLAILIVVLAAIASAEGGGGPLSGLAWRLPLMISAALAAPLSALLASRRFSGIAVQSDKAEDSIGRWQTGITLLWLGSIVFALLIGGWPRLVRENWHLGNLPLVDELLILVPAIGSLVCVWALFYKMERSFELAAYNAHGMVPPPARLLRHLWLEARHHLGLILLPTLLIVGSIESLSFSKATPFKTETAWWLVAPLLATSLILMPAALRRIWRTSPLPPGELRSLLETVCAERNCRVREILIWHTDHTQANAAVVGISHYLRYVLLSDVLLRRLHTDEVAAVLRHEVAHLRRWHLPLRLALLLAPVALWLAFGLSTEFNAVSGFAIGASLLIPLVFLAYAVIAVGWYSRLLEHDADLDACLDDDGSFNPAAAASFCQALTTLCGRTTASRWAQWTHPSIESRLQFLTKVAQNQKQATRFRRGLTAVAIAIAVIYATAAFAAAYSALV